MTPEQISYLTQINEVDNRQPYIAAVGPKEPVDYWTYKPAPGMSWVCRDYTEEKAEQLREAGWPPEILATVLCFTEPPNSGYHAVLGIRDGADLWILDSRVDDPYRKDAPPLAYRWHEIQIAGSIYFEPLA